MSETLPDTRSLIPRQPTPPTRFRSSEPKQLLNIFLKGVLEPVENALPIKKDELLQISRTGKEDISSHLVTTAILRSAGVTTSIFHYVAFMDAEHNNARVQARLRGTHKSKIGAAVLKNQMADQAADYISVQEQLKPIVLRYHKEFGDRPGADKLIRGIYQPTEALEHPVIKTIKAAEPIFGERTRIAERLFRYVYGSKSAHVIMPDTSSL